jgi:hypothetical protein
VKLFRVRPPELGPVEVAEAAVPLRKKPHQYLTGLNTHFPLTSAEVSIAKGVSFQLPLGAQFSRAVDTGV